ncbi:uncharacterized protein LOC133790144 [Humulus lupulus]|uniref:uncharacterized protein LOC133790144 n=1 Tax=Humulus lupulus TaxID=3486 RepID=UPI002B4175FF|nr:uncharacterized protein LOC133790144 [Humulus lupulus]
MLSYQGTSSTINFDPCLAKTFSNIKILVVEGYLFELPDTIKTIKKACKQACRGGSLVAITASDVSCIERHYDEFWKLLATTQTSYLQIAMKLELYVILQQRKVPLLLQGI